MGQVPVHTSAALAMLPGLPPYVKEATYVDADERRALPRRAFAGGDFRYPIHTKAATFVSAVEYWAGAERDGEIEDGLMKSARAFCMEQDICDIRCHVGPREEKQASAGDFAFEADVDGSPVRLFPMRTEDEVLKSAAAVETNRQYTTYPMRREAARNLLARAGEMNLTLGGYIRKAAGEGPATYGEVLRAIANRVAVAPPHKRELFRKLAGAVMGAGGVDGFFSKQASADVVIADPQQIAEMIDEADRICGLHAKYARGLETPEEICYHGEAPAALTMRLSKKRVPVGEVKQAGLTLDDLLPLGERFVEAVRTPFHMLDKSSGIDFAKLTVAAENLNDSDSIMLAGIVRDRMRGSAG